MKVTIKLHCALYFFSVESEVVWPCTPIVIWLAVLLSAPTIRMEGCISLSELAICVNPSSRCEMGLKICVANFYYEKCK